VWAQQALALEQITNPLAQLGLSPGNHAGWNLVQPNLQQKISHNNVLSVYRDQKTRG
jgi:hypothetical protein